MMRRFLCILTMLLIHSNMFASCYGCDCNPAGTALAAEPPTFVGVPDEDVQLSLCCQNPSPPISAEAALSMLGLSISAYDNDNYQQDEWTLIHDDIWLCHCELTSRPLESRGDHLGPIVWTGQIDPCTAGIQTITGTVSNTTITLGQVGGYFCADRDEEHGWCARDEYCTQTVALTVMETNQVTINIDVEAKDDCGSGCGNCESTARICKRCETPCDNNEDGICVPVTPCYTDDIKTCKHYEYSYTCAGSDPTCCNRVIVPVIIVGECRAGRFASCTCGDLGEEGTTLMEEEFCTSAPDPVEDCDY